MNHFAAAYYLIDIAGALLAVAIGWATARFLKVRTIKEIVSTANETINLYEAKDKAQELKIDELEAKIDGLVSQVTTLQSSLDKAMAQNELLQKLLLKAGEGSVEIPQREPTNGSDSTASQGSSN